MSLAEVIAAALTTFLASAAVVAYLIDAAGFGLMPGVVLAASIASAAAMAWSLLRGAWLGPANHLRQGYGGQEAGRHIQAAGTKKAASWLSSPSLRSSSWAGVPT